MKLKVVISFSKAWVHANSDETLLISGFTQPQHLKLIVAWEDKRSLSFNKGKQNTDFQRADH